MAKKAKELTAVEKFYIEGHRNDEPTAIAVTLEGRSPDEIKKYIDGLPPIAVPEPLMEKAGDFILTKGPDSPHCVAIMTEQAAARADEIKANTKPERFEGRIYKARQSKPQRA